MKKVRRRAVTSDVHLVRSKLVREEAWVTTLGLLDLCWMLACLAEGSPSLGGSFVCNEVNSPRFKFSTAFDSDYGGFSTSNPYRTTDDVSHPAVRSVGKIQRIFLQR